MSQIQPLVARRPRAPRRLSGAATLRAREEASNVQTDPLPEQYLMWLQESYRSKKLTDPQLVALRPKVIEAISHTPTRGLRSLELRTSQIVAVLAWAKQQHGLTQVADVFTRELIEDFCSTALGGANDKTRADYRGRLRPIADSLHPETAPVPTQTLRRKEVLAPYTQEEVRVIRRVILVQPTDEMVRQLCVCVGLGLGAGINSNELKQIRTSDVHASDDGAIRLDVPGNNARTVWIRREWEDIVARGLLGRTRESYLLGEDPSRRNVAARVFGRAHLLGDVPQLSQDRLRATWLVGHLTRATPFAVLCHAAGLSSTRALFDLLDFVPAAPAKGALRGEGC